MLAKTLSIYAHIVVLVYPNNWSTHQNIITSIVAFRYTWWRHQMETISALLALCARNSPVTGEFPSQRPGTRSFDVFFDLRLNKRLDKQSWGWWFETQSRSLWRYCNDYSRKDTLERALWKRKSGTLTSATTDTSPLFYPINFECQT